MSAPFTDSFGRKHDYLRISLTERCNLRCTYCMPPEGVELRPRADMLTFEEIDRLARFFVSRGVRKIRLTGGEPLVRKEATELVAALGRIPGLDALAMTTNGLLLAPRLEPLKAGGLTHLNISLDTLREDRFRRITLRPGLQKVLDAIDAALAHGFRPLKVNCVVLRGQNEDEIMDFVELARDRPIDVRFIEYMPFAGNGWNTDALVPFAEIESRVAAAYPAVERLEDGPNAVSRDFRIPGFAGRIGVIASMTDAFCSGCNRLRLTADGRLMVCLFGRAGVSLRDAVRDGADDDALDRLVRTAVRGKKASHDGMDVLAQTVDRPMILIGG